MNKISIIVESILAACVVALFIIFFTVICYIGKGIKIINFRRI